MSDRDENGCYVGDYDEREAAWDEKRARRTGCLCGWPDWPGQCPGPAACPVHGRDLG